MDSSAVQPETTQQTQTRAHEAPTQTTRLMTDHGNEPATYPSIETERSISGAQGLLKALTSQLPEIWQREQAAEIQSTLDNARGHFRDYLMDVSDERMRLIELSCASSE